MTVTGASSEVGDGTGTSQAYGGLKVLDLSHVLAGPYCTQMLADLGADVVKVEPPWGDATRGWGPPYVEGEAAYFLSANRGKRSVALDLRTPQAQGLVRRLARDADVLVENGRPGRLDEWGLGYRRLAADNPGLIYVSVSGFGQSGPRAQEGAYDLVLQALTGLMAATGELGHGPTRVGVALFDVLTGVTAAAGIGAALHERARSGQGQWLDLSLFDVALASMVNVAQSTLVTGESPERLGSAHPSIVPYQAFQSADGWLVLAVGGDRQFARLVELCNDEALRDPRFASNQGRVRDRSDLVRELERVLRTRGTAEWLEVLTANNIPCSPVQDIAQAMEDPQMAARGGPWHLEHTLAGTIPHVPSPLSHLSRSPARPTHAAPILGQDTRTVLREQLGLTDGDIDGLFDEGIAFEAKPAPASAV